MKAFDGGSQLFFSIICVTSLIIYIPSLTKADPHLQWSYTAKERINQCFYLWKLALLNIFSVEHEFCKVFNACCRPSIATYTELV